MGRNGLGGKDGRSRAGETKEVTFPVGQAFLRGSQPGKKCGKQLQGFRIRQVTSLDQLNKQSGQFSQGRARQVMSLIKKRTQGRAGRGSGTSKPPSETQTTTARRSCPRSPAPGGSDRSAGKSPPSYLALASSTASLSARTARPWT